MKEDCKGDGTCGRKGRGECDGGCAHELDVASLGPGAVEIAALFDEINTHLVGALKARKKVLEILHKRSSESADMKDKMDKVVASRHPVLVQFVFSQE